MLLTSHERKAKARTLELDADWQRERAHQLDDQARQLWREPQDNDAKVRALRFEADMRRQLAHERDDEARALLR